MIKFAIKHIRTNTLKGMHQSLTSNPMDAFLHDTKEEADRECQSRNKSKDWNPPDAPDEWAVVEIHIHYEVHEILSS